MLFLIAEIWKQPKCPSVRDWLNKLWSAHRIECFESIKKSDVDLRLLKGKVF